MSSTFPPRAQVLCALLSYTSLVCHQSLWYRSMHSPLADPEVKSPSMSFLRSIPCTWWGVILTHS